MSLHSHYWSDHTSEALSRMPREKLIAVLPVGAVEQHGPHMPMSTDHATVDAMVHATVAKLGPSSPVLFLPTASYGKSNEHSRYPGTITLSAQTLLALWMDIGDSVARSGVRKFVLFNSHGGQMSVMDIVARDLRCRCNLIVYSTNWFTLPLGEGVNILFSAHEHRFGIHAGDMETSMMLALRPEYVAMDQARDFRSTAQDRADKFPILGNGATAKLGWMTQDYNPLGAAGNAALATAEKGAAVLQSAGLQLALLLQEVAELPLSTLVDQPHIPL